MPHVVRRLSRVLAVNADTSPHFLQLPQSIPWVSDVESTVLALPSLLDLLPSSFPLPIPLGVNLSGEGTIRLSASYPSNIIPPIQQKK